MIQRKKYQPITYGEKYTEVVIRASFTPKDVRVAIKQIIRDYYRDFNPDSETMEKTTFEDLFVYYSIISHLPFRIKYDLLDWSMRCALNFKYITFNEETNEYTMNVNHPQLKLTKKDKILW